MTDPTRPTAEALLLQGIKAAFATAEGNVQTPERIVAFLRVAYLPEMLLAARAEGAESVPDPVEGDAEGWALLVEQAGLHESVEMFADATRDELERGLIRFLRSLPAARAEAPMSVGQYLAGLDNAALLERLAAAEDRAARAEAAAPDVAERVDVERVVKAIEDATGGTVTHLNTGTGEALAMAWSEGHTAGFEEGRSANAPALDVERLVRAIDRAWGIIANAGGCDWSGETPEWQAAASRWRDEHYPAILTAIAPPAEADGGAERCGYPECAGNIPEDQPGHRDPDFVHRCTDEVMHAELGDTARCHPFQPRPADGGAEDGR